LAKGRYKCSANNQLVDGILRLVPAQSDSAKSNEAKRKQEGSSSFLKRRTKKLFLSSVRGGRADRVNKQGNSFWSKRPTSFAFAFPNHE
jgi:hypothetical protein